jgi:hypothetical protein
MQIVHILILLSSMRFVLIRGNIPTVTENIIQEISTSCQKLKNGNANLAWKVLQEYIYSRCSELPNEKFFIRRVV